MPRIYAESGGMEGGISVERLTERHYKESSGYYMKCSETCHIECGEKSYCEEVDNIVDRLGAIEDILGDDYDLDRLRELVQADRDGRCVVRPCKIGDTVYEIRCAEESESKRKYARKKYDYSVSAFTWKMKAFPEKCYVSEKKCTKSDFIYMGRTVFLTREAAEAALKGEQNE